MTFLSTRCTASPSISSASNSTSLCSFDPLFHFLCHLIVSSKCFNLSSSLHHHYAQIMVKSSGKLMLLDKLLPKLKADGHRVLIFSQFRIMLNIIEDYIHMRGYTYERIDGAVKGEEKRERGVVLLLLTAYASGCLSLN